MDTEESSTDFIIVNNETDTSLDLFASDKAILLDILPSNVWACTFQKLVDKHPRSLENVSNSSLYFRNLILSRRVLFLFPQVFKILGPGFANQKDTKIKGSTIIKTRTICKSWNHAVDQFINDDTVEPDFFKTQTSLPSDHALVNARYYYFGHMESAKLPKFLAHFQQTHLPHSSRSPFIGNVVHIDLTGFTDNAELASIADQVSTLLRKYGHHIKILNLGLFRLENHSWLLDCLGYCTNLTHLKVFERFNSHGEIDVAFGERPDPRRRMPGCNAHSQMEQRLNAMDNFIRNMFNQYRGNRPLGFDCQHDHNNASLVLPVVTQNRPIDNNPIQKIATFKKLKCLKLSQLSSLNFNSLISANTHVVWLQIEPLRIAKQKYLPYYSMEFPNLKKLSIKLCSPSDVRALENVHESWLQLTHLHFDYCSTESCCVSPEFMAWTEIFGVIEQKWGKTLTDLKLRLPMARKQDDREQIRRDSTQERLHLPRLKRLKIWLSEKPGESRVAKTDFLELLRVQLEEIIIE